MLKRANNLFAPICDLQNIKLAWLKAIKGTHAAVMHAFGQTKNFKYFLKLDVRKYFDSIDHRVLLQQIVRLVKDENVLCLLHGIIASYKIAAGKGLPIGNLTSQFFANHYLAGLDHFILEKLKPGG